MTQCFEKDSRVLLAIHFLSLVESMASADTEGLVNMEELLAVEEEDDLSRSYARLDIAECTVQCHEIFPNQRQEVISAWPGVYVVLCWRIWSKFGTNVHLGYKT